MNPFISKNTVWRSGVVLRLEGSRALIKADTEDRFIFNLERMSAESKEICQTLVLEMLVDDNDHATEE